MNALQKLEQLKALVTGDGRYNNMVWIAKNYSKQDLINSLAEIIEDLSGKQDSAEVEYEPEECPACGCSSSKLEHRQLWQCPACGVCQ